MKLKRFLLSSALALSFVATTPVAAKADPISAAIVAFVGFTGTAAAVATFVINSALYASASWALSKASQALGKQKQAVQERQASVLNLSIGEVPREVAFGHVCSGGSLIDAFNHGGQYGTDHVTRIIALADHAIDGLFGYYIDDQFFTWSGDGQQAGFEGKLAIEFRNATGDPVDLPAVAAAGGWGETDELRSVTHAWVTHTPDDKVFPQGHPQIRFSFRGLCVYDPRKDAALGYTGPNPHVWEDRSTHEITQNAAINRYAFQRGIFAEGHQGDPAYLLIGRGLTAEEAPPERIIAAANLCDEEVEPDVLRYLAAGVIRASDDFATVEQMFAAAMAGVIVQREGGVEIEPGQAKAAVATITDRDLVVGEAVTFSAFLPDTDGGRLNTVVPRYIEPAQNWADHSGPVRRDLDDIAADGRPLEATLPLVLVTVGNQADRCAEIMRRKSRLERRATLVLPPEYAWLEEGDWIAWQSDRRHGGATVRYQIEGWALDKAWRMHVQLREIASSVFGVPDPIENTAEVPPAPPVIDALTLPGADAQAITLAGEASVIPAVRFVWDTPVDSAIRAIRGEVRFLGDTEISSTRFEGDALAAGVGIATNGVAAGQVLQARLVPIGDPSRPVLPSAWVTITTGELTAGDATSVGGTRAEELLAFFREIPRLMDDGDQAAEVLIRETLDRHERVLFEAEARIGADLLEMTERVAAITAEAAARVAGLLAEAAARGTAIAGVTSSISTVATNLAAEITTRAAQYAATTAAVALVDSHVTTVATAISAETAARIAAISAVNDNIAGVVSSVSTVATNLASLTSSMTTQFSATNGTLSSHTTSISTNATAISAETAARIAAISAVNDNVAGVVSSVSTVATNLASLTSSMTTQFSAANGTLSSHTTSISTNATAISAETAARIAAISAVNDNIASVSSAVTTVATDLAAETAARIALAASTSSGFASVGVSLTALSTADTNMAAAILNVASQATTRGNLIKNSTGALGFEHWTVGSGWSTSTSQLWGPRFENSTNGTLLMHQATADVFEVQPSAWYTMQADFLRSATSGSIWMDIAWLKSDGSASSITPYSARIGTSANRDYGAILSAEVQAPSDAAKGQARYFLESVGGNTICGVRRPKVERGRLPATGWTDDRTEMTTGSSAIFALSALNGNEAYATIGTDVDGRITLMRINGADGAVDFLAEQFNITSAIGEGIEYDADEKIFKIFDATSKTVLKASGDIRFWSGPSSVDDGDETAENGVLALGPGLTGGGRFNGQTLTVPFDTGAPSATIIDLSASYTNIDEIDATMVAGGAMQLNMFDLDMSGDATADMDGYRTYEIEWRLASVNLSYGDHETLTGGEFSHALPPGAPVTFLTTGQVAFDFHAVTKGGDRKLVLQMRFKSGSATTLASVRNTRMRGWTIA